jgi:hypothetical protein
VELKSIYRFFHSIFYTNVPANARLELKITTNSQVLHLNNIERGKKNQMVMNSKEKNSHYYIAAH